MADLDLLIKIRSDLKGLKDSVDGIQKTKKEATGLKALFTQGLGMGVGSAAVQGFTRALGAMNRQLMNSIKTGVTFNATLEQSEVAFTTLLGSAGAARKRIQELYEFSARTPFQLDEVIGANRVLQSLTQGALASEQGMKLVGDSAAAVGRNFNEVTMWVGRLYAGLESGTAVGEATLRLLEMGLVTGETKQKLDLLAASSRTSDEAIQILENTFGRFSGSMQMQSQTFNGLLSTLKDNFKGFAATSTQPLFDGLKNAMKTLLSMKDQAMGVAEGIATAWDLAFSSFKDGTWGNVITLAIQAGFEQASQAIQDLWVKVYTTSFGTDLLKHGINGVMSFANKAAKILLTLFRFPLDMLQAGLVKVASEIDVMVDRIRTLGRSTREAVTLEEALAAVREQNQANQGQAEAFLDRQLNAAREALGLKTQEKDLTDQDLSATQNLLALFDSIAKKRKEAKAAREAEAAAAAAAGTGGGGSGSTFNAKTAFENERKTLEDTRAAMAQVEGNFALTQADKWQMRKALLDTEKQILDEIIQKLEKKMALEADPAARAAMQQSLEELTQQRETSTDESFNLGADPTSFQDQFTTQMVGMLDSVGTMAEATAGLFAAPFQGALSGIQGSIQGLLQGTMTWGDALRNIGSSVVGALINSFSQMAVAWIANQLKMFLFGQKLKAADTASTAAKGAADAAAMAPAATMSSIASFGSAAALGLAAVVAALAVFGGFAKGGYTGDGGRLQPAGIVHRGEFVMDAATTRKAGIQNLESFRQLINAGSQGFAMGGAVGNAPAVSTITEAMGGSREEGGSQGINVAMFDDRSDLKRWADSEEGQTVILDVVRKNFYQLT